MDASGAKLSSYHPYVGTKSTPRSRPAPRRRFESARTTRPIPYTNQSIATFSRWNRSGTTRYHPHPFTPSPLSPAPQLVIPRRKITHDVERAFVLAQTRLHASRRRSHVPRDDERATRLIPFRTVTSSTEKCFVHVRANRARVLGHVGVHVGDGEDVDEAFFGALERNARSSRADVVRALRSSARTMPSRYSSREGMWGRLDAAIESGDGVAETRIIILHSRARGRRDEIDGRRPRGVRYGIACAGSVSI